MENSEENMHVRFPPPTKTENHFAWHNKHKQYNEVLQAALSLVGKMRMWFIDFSANKENIPVALFIMLYRV